MLIGLTGGIASGKSTVARLLKERGAVHLDADALVHELYADENFAARVQSLFETPILDAQGLVERAQLGKIVFDDAKALKRLEKLVHPAVARLRDEKLRENADAECIVLEAVKLVEARQAEKCDVVWCVWSNPAVQLRRLMETRNLSEAEARARLAHQPPLEVKRELLKHESLKRRANQVPFVVIENNGTLQELEEAVGEQWLVISEQKNRPLTTEH